MKQLLYNALSYCNANSTELIIDPIIGAGEDGSVWSSEYGSAIKAFERDENYEKELECYQRLDRANISEINGLAVPRLIGFDDEKRIVEMTIVQEPYILDFGKVYLDQPPPYANDPHIIEWHEAKILRDFGPNATQVFMVLHHLRTMGIYYADPHCRNICF